MNLTDPGELKALLARHGLVNQKKWGQHFLVSRPVVDAIVGSVAAFQGVLEVGPGPGVLTHDLCTSHPVIAYEVDPVAVSVLTESAPSAVIRHEDALAVDLGAALGELPEPRAIVSNMPYNITGPLLTLFARHRGLIGQATLMMQKEVGERILAQPGNSDRGSLSVFLQFQFEIRKLCNAPKGAFFPPPKVDSVVLVLTPRPDSPDDKLLDRIRVCFAQPRKTLLNNLLAIFPREEAVARLGRAGLAESVRPHQLTQEQWLVVLG